MMVYGEGVAHMYGVIVQGRQNELFTKDLTPEMHKQRTDEMAEFCQQVKRCKPSQFQEWYELYKDSLFGKTGTRRVKR